MKINFYKIKNVQIPKELKTENRTKMQTIDIILFVK